MSGGLRHVICVRSVLCARWGVHRCAALCGGARWSRRCAVGSASMCCGVRLVRRVRRFAATCSDMLWLSAVCGDVWGRFMVRGGTRGWRCAGCCSTAEAPCRTAHRRRLTSMGGAVGCKGSRCGGVWHVRRCVVLRVSAVCSVVLTCTAACHGGRRKGWGVQTNTKTSSLRPPSPAPVGRPPLRPAAAHFARVHCCCCSYRLRRGQGTVTWRPAARCRWRHRLAGLAVGYAVVGVRVPLQLPFPTAPSPPCTAGPRLPGAVGDGLAGTS